MTSISREERVDLLPCDFCGQDAACIHDYDDGYWRVICPCTAFGPLRGTEVEAIAAWNTRTSPDVSQSEGMVTEALERALRIELWNRMCGLRSQDEVLREINRKVEGIKTEARALSNTPEKGESE
jgi:hypothetical protein